MFHANQSNELITDDVSLMQRRLDRERRARQQAEAVLEAKSLDLYQKHQELVRLNARLEDRVKQRTEELAEAMEKAQRASAAKGEFLARMSHEIRTPMNGVLGMLEALKMTSLQADQADYIETAHTSANSLLALINDILDFSKIEAGQMAIEAIRFDLPAQLQHALDLWQTKAQASNLYLRSAFDSKMPRWVNGDPTRLSQILTNLISNALKFTHQGGVTLRVDVSTDTPISPEQITLVFTVEDTGIGIPEEARSRLFTAFMQADGSTSRRYGGTGLGLAICDQLAKLMHGNIVVESEQGRGTRFILKLTLGLAGTDNAAVATSAFEHQADREGTDAIKFRKGKILVVDDNDTNRKVALTILKRYGIDPDLAEDGQQAVQAVQANQYDLVLMDCHMPVVDGYEATTQIREWEQREARKPLTIIAVTASAFQEDRDRCAACGMNDFVAKPINLRAIRAVLERWMPLVDAPTMAVQAQSEQEAVAIATQTSPALAGSEHTQPLDVPNDKEFDQEQYEELREIAASEFPGMLEQFHRNIQDSLQLLHAASSNGDAEALRKISHRLKGSTATLGAKLLATESAELEKEARAGNVSHAIERVERLRNYYQRMQRWPQFRR